MSEWIKCSDRMPDIGQEVLIRIPVCEYFNIESATYKSEGKFIGCWFSSRGSGCSYKVTHWMPLPVPPEGIMKTLTAQKAREIRDAIINNSAVIEPTIRDHYVAQAMEMAMVVLDAQRDADLFGRGYVSCVHGESPRRIDPKTVNLIHVEG